MLKQTHRSLPQKARASSSSLKLSVRDRLATMISSAGPVTSKSSCMVIICSLKEIKQRKM